MISMNLEDGSMLHKLTGIIKTIYTEKPLWFGYIGSDEVFLLKLTENKETLLEKYNLKINTKVAGKYIKTFRIFINRFPSVLNLSCHLSGLWSGGFSADIRCFTIIGGIFLSIKTFKKNSSEGQTSIYYIDCSEKMINGDESCVKIQQIENSTSCELYGDVSTIVHSHQVNQNGNIILIMQSFC